MKLHTQSILIFSFSAITFACVLYSSAFAQSTKTSLPFRTIAKGWNSSHKERKTYIITNQKGWSHLRNKVGDLNPALSNVRFSKWSIIAVFQGQKSSSGYSIEIEKIFGRKHSVEIRVKEVSPGSLCIVGAVMTNPYHIIKTIRINKKLVFLTRQQVKECK